MKIKMRVIVTRLTEADILFLVSVLMNENLFLKSYKYDIADLQTIINLRLIPCQVFIYELWN